VLVRAAVFGDDERVVIRKAFRMRLEAGAATEYARRHNPVWPELEATFAQHGVQSYSIFLDPETNDLFAYAEIESEERWNAIAATEVCRRWWQHMGDLMPTKPDSSPISSDLREVFLFRAAKQNPVR
jgi:L-rhamnose mutarotase